VGRFEARLPARYL